MQWSIPLTLVNNTNLTLNEYNGPDGRSGTSVNINEWLTQYSNNSAGYLPSNTSVSFNVSGYSNDILVISDCTNVTGYGKNCGGCQYQFDAYGNFGWQTPMVGNGNCAAVGPGNLNYCTNGQPCTITFNG